MGMTDQDEALIDSFIQQKKSDEENLTLQFATEIVTHMLHKKEIDGYIKDIKTDAKANGIAVNKVMKAIAQLKKELKTTDLEKSEEETILIMLEQDLNVKTKIQKLVDKD